jgi:hypothetical protein
MMFFEADGPIFAGEEQLIFYQRGAELAGGNTFRTLAESYSRFVKECSRPPTRLILTKAEAFQVLTAQDVRDALRYVGPIPPYPGGPEWAGAEVNLGIVGQVFGMSVIVERRRPHELREKKEAPCSAT